MGVMNVQGILHAHTHCSIQYLYTRVYIDKLVDLIERWILGRGESLKNKRRIFLYRYIVYYIYIFEDTRTATPRRAADAKILVSVGQKKLYK